LKGFADPVTCFKFHYLNTSEDIFGISYYQSCESDMQRNVLQVCTPSSGTSSPMSLTPTPYSLIRGGFTPSFTVHTTEYSGISPGILQQADLLRCMSEYPPLHVTDVLKIKDKMVMLLSYQPPFYIEYVNNLWADFCEWEPHEILGCTCDVLQGYFLLTHLLTHTLTHSLAYSLTHSLTRLLTHSPTHSLNHSHSLTPR